MPFTAIASVVGVYIWIFAPSSGWTLSRDSEQWARFGEYVGGIFGVAAFVGVLVTIYIQRQQIREQRDQFQLDEMQRLMTGISGTIDAVLAAEPQRMTDRLRAKMRENGSGPMSLYAMLRVAGSAVALPAADPLIQAQYDDLRKRIVSSVSVEAGLVEAELEQLFWCLEEYANAGGNPIIARFYQRRYKELVLMLSVTGLIKSPNLERFFLP